ncbi:MAG TPA: LacI family DNA-binding transcriptional regulator [Capsulimonadaceae bacterium]|jgi:LacI family transcriptional regulator
MALKRVSSTDIAKVAGVSQATVSYVLNRRPGKTISEQTRERVWSAARDLGYQPNAAARALVTGKTGMVALWMPNAYRPIFSSVTEAVMRHAVKHSYRVVVSEVINYSNLPADYRDNIADWHVDGIIGHDARSAIDHCIDTSRGISPAVSIGPAYTTRCDHVGVDLYGGSQVAVKHLIEIGCKKIAFVSVDWGLNIGDPRYRAFTELCEAAGIQPRFISILTTDRAQARDAVEAYVLAYPDTDGLFCWNDDVAIAANRAMRDLGRSVPDDIAIIGSDGIEETSYHSPSVSSVAQPIEEMVTTAWTFLRNRLEDPTCELQSLVLPMKLLQRESTSR